MKKSFNKDENSQNSRLFAILQGMAVISKTLHDLAIISLTFKWSDPEFLAEMVE